MSTPSKPEHGATVIILDSQNRVLLQLRDDLPHINYPAHWGLFGGTGPENEKPQETARREVIEEIGLSLNELALVRVFKNTKKTWKTEYAYVARVENLDDSRLSEGRECRFFTAGECQKLLIIPDDLESINEYFRQRIHLTLVAGTRPNFMKIAALVHELRKNPIFAYSVVHTGQHYDLNMSKVFFAELGIDEPAINFEIHGGTIEEQASRIEDSFSAYLEKNSTDYVVVVGDVTSTVACSRVAANMGVRLVHVEAGLRSFDVEMPEERNRVETDKLSDLLFVTEESGMHNLRQEKCKGQAFLVGNVMIDTLVHQLPAIDRSDVLRRLEVTPGSYAICTFHRPSNTDYEHSLSEVVEIITYLSKKTLVIFPVHPRTRLALERFSLRDKLSSHNVQLLEPLSYLDFMALVKNAKLLVTDSGGIQEETTFLKVPCITMRKNTERPVTVELGTNVLCPNPDALRKAIDAITVGQEKKGNDVPLWDGRASVRILDAIAADYLNRQNAQ